MKVNFSIHYATVWGEELYVVGSSPALGMWNPAKAVRMQYSPGDEWRADVIFQGLSEIAFEYKYLIRRQSGGIEWEWGANRHFAIEGKNIVNVRDTWRTMSDIDNIFTTSAFCRVIFARDKKKTSATESKKGSNFRLQITVPRIEAEHTICVSGNAAVLGRWSAAKAVPMSDTCYPLWTLDLAVKESEIPFTYKYLIKDKLGKIVYKDEIFRNAPSTGDAERSHRKRGVAKTDAYTIITDAAIHYDDAWRGAGVAIPVFSLRSKNGFGVGEFSDLKALADWASACALQLIQLLPVNDTSVTMTWWDSYPYANISVFALHPIYLNLEAIGGVTDEMAKEIDAGKKIVNGYDHVNYEEVMAAKMKFARELFQRTKNKLFSSKEFKQFFDGNAFWLKPYAAFSALRDTHKTADATAWPRYQTVTEDDIGSITAEDFETFDASAFYYFLQYHLHCQLSDAAAYCREKHVVLKGDIPIGIHKHSDSCWLHPELFNMNASAGAPPDPFSDTGQNWGFPTYNWNAMVRDGYAWWRERLAKMSDYFQMVRLDHVLGFFRIWEIPDAALSGLMGHFNPAVPLSREELERKGIWDFNRLSEPYIPLWLVKIVFGHDADNVIASYLEPTTPGHYKLRPEFDTQRKIDQNMTLPGDASDEARLRHEKMKQGLLFMTVNVILFRDPNGPGFHPRINMMDTPSFDCLDVWIKETLIGFYNDYFYKRQNDFWRAQAMTKLPVLKNASPMLIAGEDLGMIPDCVAPVMEELGIIGLRIQRMPQEKGVEFSDPARYPYLTVCTTSSHDMSTIRGWWGENYPRIERYYRTILNKEGDAPSAASGAIVREIIEQHLESPSIWAIFPIQDILAMSDTLRRPGDPREEQINDPANPHHYWKFRLHITLEQLCAEKKFNLNVAKMVADAGRSRVY